MAIQGRLWPKWQAIDPGQLLRPREKVPSRGDQLNGPH